MRRMLSMLMAILFVVSIPLTALAVEVDVSLGNVTINDTNVQHTTSEGFMDEAHGGSVTVTGSSDTNSVTITAGSTKAPANVHVEIKTNEGGNTNVVLNDANIESPRGAMEVTGGGDVVIELDGENSLVSTNNSKAGLQVAPDSSITIQDANNDGGSLTAQGATWGAGIGGNANDAHGDVTITGGTVVATGGSEAAGIGGGQGTVNGNITITGGNVTAQGANGAAGIGSGSYGIYGGDAGDITISGGTVTASGGTGAAGIGGGREGLVGDITITDGNVTAKGGADYFETGGAGIGSGMSGIMGDLAINETEGTVAVNSNDIIISGGDITATGGGKAADIGHGTTGNKQFPEDPVDIIISGDAEIKTSGEDDAVIGAGDRSAEVTVDTSKLTPEGSINGVAGTYVPPAPPAPEPEYTPVYTPAPAEPELPEAPAQVEVKIDTEKEIVVDLAAGTQDGKPMEKIEVEVETVEAEENDTAEAVVIPANTTIVIHKVEIAAEETVEEVAKEEVAMVFAVSCIQENVVTSLPGVVKLSIPAPEFEMDGFVLVFVNANGEQIEIPYKLVDGKLVFETEFVGLYMIVKK